jgi:alpha-acetolactate decarboxylase
VCVFETVRTRTVPAQHQPYPPLAQATAGQQEAEFALISGTLAGYRMPDYEHGVAAAGYHLALPANAAFLHADLHHRDAGEEIRHSDEG